MMCNEVAKATRRNDVCGSPHERRNVTVMVGASKAGKQAARCQRQAAHFGGDWEELTDIGPCWGAAKGFGRTKVYYKVINFGWVADGRKRIGNYNKAAASSSKPIKSAALYIPETHDVVTIDDLGDGCLYVFDSLLQPGDVQAKLLPPHMKKIIFQPPGPRSTADMQRCRHKGVSLGHLHDAPLHQEPMYFRFNGVVTVVGQTGRTYSPHGALTHDLVRQAAGQAPPTSPATSCATRWCPHSQVLEEIDIGSLEGGLVPELSRWASLPLVDNSSNLCRPGKRRKLAKVVPQLPGNTAAAPVAEPANDEAAAAGVVGDTNTCKHHSSSSAAGAASSSAGPRAMLGAAAGLLALSAAKEDAAAAAGYVMDVGGG
ncbi:hypothetical protein COO60DRAFT_1624304 [Scenedesmus sp. NREL 46B-D3]|nr:hypothetical protein COO60DRAFT_1624304 [Scenedesmus sp. NREL 46B-D3]